MTPLRTLKILLVALLATIIPGAVAENSGFQGRSATIAEQYLLAAANQERSARGLPLLHRDPFDRLLVAQAEIEGLTLMTTDKKLVQYGPHVKRFK